MPDLDVYVWLRVLMFIFHLINSSLRLVDFVQCMLMLSLISFSLSSLRLLNEPVNLTVHLIYLFLFFFT